LITGEDTVVIVAAADLSAIVDRILTSLAERWPAMLVSVNEGGQQHTFTEWRNWVGRLPKNRGDVMIARDLGVRSMWEDQGYFTDAAGEGPLTIYYEPCKGGFIKTSLCEEPYIREVGYGFDPYDGLILGDRCSVLTLVSPDGASRLRDEMLHLLRGAVAERR
jgi:hypothetical protein